MREEASTSGLAMKDRRGYVQQHQVDHWLKHFALVSPTIQVLVLLLLVAAAEAQAKTQNDSSWCGFYESRNLF